MFAILLLISFKVLVAEAVPFSAPPILACKPSRATFTLVMLSASELTFQYNLSQFGVALVEFVLLACASNCKAT